MIRGFRDAATELVFRGECPKGFPATLLKVAGESSGCSMRPVS
jgi:hypothetical protein